jgi:predicted dinucleotide-binding enzyme
MTGKIVIDTTNQFGSGPMPPADQTAAQLNAARMPAARYTKSFNTLTAAFQAEAAGRQGAVRVVQWICGDDAEAKQIVAGLIDDAGFAPVDLGGTADCAVMEAPRRLRNTGPAPSTSMFRSELVIRDSVAPVRKPKSSR